MKFKDLTGNRYGKLVVLSVSHKDERGVFYWKCVCDCGKEHVVARNSLQQGKTTSCGCYASQKRVELNTTHGMHGTKIYKVWAEMINRTTNPNHANSKYYFDRGIGVCEEWKSFDNFYRDMGDRPEGAWLERKDNSKSYSKDNCIWQSPCRQCSNRTSGKNKSGRLGVYFDSSSGKWRALIKVDGKRIDCGRFTDFEAACDAITQAEIKHLGYSREDWCSDK